MASQITMSTHSGNGTVSDYNFTSTDVLTALNTSDYNAMKDIKTLDSVLATADGVYWTTLRLMQENIWDKLYWLRVKRKGATPNAGALT